MAEYISPCNNGKCDVWSGSEIQRDICQATADTIIAAGGAALLETVMCPMLAQVEMGRNMDNPVIAQLAARIGLLGPAGDADIGF